MLVAFSVACTDDGNRAALDRAPAPEAADPTEETEKAAESSPDGPPPSSVSPLDRHLVPLDEIEPHLAPGASVELEAAPVIPPNSADRWVLWAGCSQIVTLTDAELDEWRARGAAGFVCQAADIVGIGGTSDFSGRDRPPAGDAFELERSIVASRIVQRAAERDMKMYLGFYAVNRGENQPTPFAEWFDDRRWGRSVLPALERIASAAAHHGFAGLAIDQELYPAGDGRTQATWSWRYPGNERSEDEVRAQVRRRGAQVMKRLVRGFPGVEVVAYHTFFPETWDALLQQEENGIENAYEDWTQVEFWDGMSGTAGYGAIRLLNAGFYKSHQIGGSWDIAFQYHYNSLFAVLSQRFTGWDVAHDRFHESPFAWVSEGPSRFERARSREHVAEQFAAFSKWGMGREFANYAWGDTMRSFDYGPYEAAMRGVTTPRIVDGQRPILKLSPPEVDGPPGARSVTLRGTATDNLAIRFVRWQDEEGHVGTAKMRWEILDGGIEHGFEWQMSWVIEGLPLQRGENRLAITAEDIKGLSTTHVLSVVA
jgi:hypothetical protein